MKLTHLKTKQKNISNIGRITSAIQTISMVKKQQANKMYKKVLIALSILRKHIAKHDYSNFSKNTVHLIFTVDKKFCRDFIHLTHKYISGLKYDQNDKFISFGKYAIDSLKKEKIFPDCVQLLNIISSIEDAYASSMIIMKHLRERKKITLHFYSTQESQFVAKDIFNGYLHNNLEDHTIPLYIAYCIYAASIETSIIENASRAIAMSQASDTCKTMQHKLKLQYNRLRQEKITMEMSEIMGGISI